MSTTDDNDPRDYLNELIDEISDELVLSLVKLAEAAIPPARLQLIQEKSTPTRPASVDYSDWLTLPMMNTLPGLVVAGERIIIHRIAPEMIRDAREARRRGLIGKDKWLVIRHKPTKEEPDFTVIRILKVYASGSVAVISANGRFTMEWSDYWLDLWEVVEVIPSTDHRIEPSFRRALERCGFDRSEVE